MRTQWSGPCGWGLTRFPASGELLLFDALARFARTPYDLGFELVVDDALREDAACFYLKYGFRRFADHELRLFMTTRDLRATFDADPVEVCAQRVYIGTALTRWARVGPRPKGTP